QRRADGAVGRRPASSQPRRGDRDDAPDRRGYVLEVQGDSARRPRRQRRRVLRRLAGSRRGARPLRAVVAFGYFPARGVSERDQFFGGWRSCPGRLAYLPRAESAQPESAPIAGPVPSLKTRRKPARNLDAQNAQK